jgi:hypothetical protein
MTSVIRSIHSSRIKIAQGHLESTQENIVESLLSNKTVFDGEVIHSFEDALQSVWAVDSNAESIDAELKKIACGESDSLDALKRILILATDEYAEKITEKVALYDLEVGINHFVESLDTNEFKSLRGLI